MNIRNASPASRFLPSLRAISTQAEALSKNAEPELVADFLQCSFLSTVEKHAPGTEISAYAGLVEKTAADVATLPGELPAEIRSRLWSTALQVAAQGVPGGAGVALAKTVESVGSEFLEGTQASIACSALKTLRDDETLALRGENLHATLALDAAGQLASPEGQNVILRNAISVIASLEGWNIS